MVFACRRAAVRTVALAAATSSATFSSTRCSWPTFLDITLSQVSAPSPAGGTGEASAAWRITSASDELSDPATACW